MPNATRRQAAARIATELESFKMRRLNRIGGPVSPTAQDLMDGVIAVVRACGKGTSDEEAILRAATAFGEALRDRPIRN